MHTFTSLKKLVEPLISEFIMFFRKPSRLTLTPFVNLNGRSELTFASLFWCIPEYIKLNLNLLDFQRRILNFCGKFYNESPLILKLRVVLPNEIGSDASLEVRNDR